MRIGAFMNDGQGQLTSREKWLICGLVVLAAVAGFLAWAWISSLVPYEQEWGTYAEWVSALSTFFGFGAAVVTIAITRRKYAQERDQFLTGERAREEREREVALGVLVHLLVEAVRDRRKPMEVLRRKRRSDLKYVCVIENNSSFPLDNVEILFPEPSGTDRNEWESFDIRTVPTQEAGATVPYEMILPPSHPDRKDCQALFESMYSVRFTLNGTRWERNKLGLQALDYSWALRRD